MLSRVTGLSGAIKAGPIPAASLGPWTLARVEGEPRGTFAFDSTLQTVDSFWITRTPHDLCLNVGTEVVVYRGVRLTVSGSHASGVVRAEQRSTAHESRESQQQET